MITGAQQRKHDRADRGHAGAEAGGGDALFHPVDLLFQRRGRRIALPAVGVALRPSLKYRGQVTGIAVAVRDRKVQGLVQRAVLDRGVAIGMQYRGGEAALTVQIAHVRSRSPATKNPSGSPPNGFCVPRLVSPGWSGPRFSGIFYAPAS